MSVAILEKEAVRHLAVPVSIELYHELALRNRLPPRTELLAGAIIETMPKNPPHAAVLTRLFRFFHGALGPGYLLRKEDPLTLEDSEPEPDLAIVEARPDDYASSHPGMAYLVVEVANTSRALDREKALIYSRAGIPEYWIFDLVDRVVEVYREPSPEGYRTMTRVPPDATLSPLFASEAFFIPRNLL